MKRIVLCTILAVHTFTALAQELERPKLVVGIVVDQMRYDFLYRYWEKYSAKGFKRLVTQGYSCENTHYNYFPTYTGPGHAAIYTGTTPANNGIVGNDWYVRENKQRIYVTADETVTGVGTSNSTGPMSPRNLLVSTITDQLRLGQHLRSKVIGLALKDRGAILPAGHLANAAYWFDGATGNFVTSSYYRKNLPAWVDSFNNLKLAPRYCSQTWNPLLPVEEYTESTPDDNPAEKSIVKDGKPVFPYDLPALSKENFDVLRKTPFGNTFTERFAEAAIAGEQLGQSTLTDFLCVSFSATDYVGHYYGPSSVEIEDTYLRLDQDIARLLDYLDKNIGKGKYLVFLTADHGVVEMPAHLKRLGLPGGYFNYKQAHEGLKQHLTELYKVNLVADMLNDQVYLDHELIAAKRLDLHKVQEVCAEYLEKYEGVERVFTAEDISHNRLPLSDLDSYRRGYNKARCGDVFIQLKPGWMDKEEGLGTTHGSVYEYDTHVPLLWYGWKIPKGSTAEQVYISDIAPTLAVMLHILAPNASTGKPIVFPAGK